VHNSIIGKMNKNKRLHIERSKTRAGFLFALPWIIGFLVFSLYPIGTSLYYSFTNFNIFQAPQWVGFGNYAELFADEKFYKSLWNTFYMVIFSIPINLSIALSLAQLLNQKIRGVSIFRTLFYMPSIVPAVASSMLWLWILNPQYGFLNSGLKKLGLPLPNWLMDPSFTKPSLVIMGVWSLGNMVVIFLAALQNVPRNQYEAAEIDGANAFKKFCYVTLPSISPTIFFQLIMGIIAYFQYFTQAYVLINGASAGSGLNEVNGGAENSLLLYSLYLFHNAFGYFKMGKASAMAWILFIIIMGVTAIIFKSQEGWVSYGDE
jgi:multiple sugar transport system permease protein